MNKMENQKKCPACNRWINKDLEQCPICGFNDLNVYFLYKEDYQEWVNVKLLPHKAKMFRFFAGHDGVLILTGSGKLYGMGNNNTGRFGNEKIGEELKSPQLIAENIKSAALGYHYSIYLTKDGIVKLIGKTQIPYANSFRSFNDVTDVYASLSEDVFWLFLSDGSLRVWGDNTNASIAPRTSQFVKNFKKVEVIVTDEHHHYWYRNYPNPKEIYAGEDKEVHSNRSEVLGSTATQLKRTDDFKKYVGQDEVNFDIEFDFISRGQLINEPGCDFVEQWTGEDDWIHKERWRYNESFQSKLILTNRYFLNPEPASDTKCFHRSDFELNSIDLTSLAKWEKNINTQSIKKIERFSVAGKHYLAVLEEDFSLKILNDEEILSVIPNIVDISIGFDKVYIVTKDGQIRRNYTQNLVNAFIEIKLP